MCYSLLHYYYYYYILLLHTSYSYFIYIHTSYFEVCVNVLKLKNKLYLLATGYYQLLVLPGSCQFASSQQLQLQLERCTKLKVVKVKKSFFIISGLSVCSFAHHHISPYHISHHHLCVIILIYLSPPQLQLAIY